MAASRISTVVQHLRGAAALVDRADQTDGQLLESFVSRQDQAALEALVRRHAAMVWGVCRRVLRNHHDAEDAFQATFLVLVRRAASVTPREMVGNWLYGVAQQTARKAKTTRARRRMREAQQTTMPEPAERGREGSSDLNDLLDQELALLPENSRAVIVLCDLEGKTRREVARALGCPEGTVASRLARARSMLAERLAWHGLALSGGMVATALATTASASVPASVLCATLKAVTLVAAGHAVTATVSPNVAALTEGVLKPMLLTKLKTALAVLLVFAALGTGAALHDPTRTREQQKPRQTNETANQTQPQPTQHKQPEGGSAPGKDDLQPVPTVLGPKAFRDGDEIEITEVRATQALLDRGDTVVVRGRFRLVTQDQAQLCLYLTTSENDGLAEVERSQVARVKRGRGDFELKLTIKHKGALHLTFYDQAGRPFGGVYFGTAQQMKQIKHWSLDYYLEGGKQRREAAMREAAANVEAATVNVLLAKAELARAEAELARAKAILFVNKAALAAPAPKVPEELLKASRDAARQTYEGIERRVRGGQGNASELPLWSRRWLDAELALSDKQDHKIAAYQAHWERMKTLEDLALALFRAGQGHQSDATAAAYFRVEAEILYFQAAGKRLRGAK